MPDTACLHCENGNFKGLDFFLDHPKMRIGRGENCDISLMDPLASAEHAEIVSQNGAWFIRDLGSLNGTFVNDIKVNAGEIRTGDRIRIGNTQLRMVVDPS